jgi:hypothetical protein
MILSSGDKVAEKRFRLLSAKAGKHFVCDLVSVTYKSKMRKWFRCCMSVGELDRKSEPPEEHKMKPVK